MKHFFTQSTNNERSYALLGDAMIRTKCVRTTYIKAKNAYLLGKMHTSTYYSVCSEPPTGHSRNSFPLAQLPNSSAFFTFTFTSA
jgi:hypothetical protein